MFIALTIIVSVLLLVTGTILLLLLRLGNKRTDTNDKLSQLEKSQDRIERVVKEEISLNRKETSLDAHRSREEISAVLERMREAVEGKLQSIQEDNSKKLEQMRVVVDEKLHDTLEKRFGESFKLVNDRLESVYKGLGEMQTLASGVGDLKKVLTNVKMRGTWGEIQLGNILEQMLAPDQYAKNVVTKKGSSYQVEFAVKFPVGGQKTVWLPIDAKFPKEDYERLIEAQDKADVELINEIGKSLENRIKIEAKDIKEKYIDPPNTTNVGFLFLGTEGLYAEVLRRTELVDFLQRKYRVIVTGPTTITAFLNIVQMGAQAFAIEKRAVEVWELLGAVKSEFGRFGEILEKTHKKLQEAGTAIEDASRKSRTIERKLKNVQQLPSCPPSQAVGDALEVEYEGESQGNS
ncbi:MAG: DNA recombination protein RmuC [Candidatus Omnitrophota bacterium]|nr:MAG: DNA recombination protein RmuC [Candidatus Omnitrophota bacterium]